MVSRSGISLLMKKPCRRFSDKAESGANSRDRTDDLRITNALLYQLSYIGVKRLQDYHCCRRKVKHPMSKRGIQGGYVGRLPSEDRFFFVYTGLTASKNGYNIYTLNRWIVILTLTEHL